MNTTPRCAIGSALLFTAGVMGAAAGSGLVALAADREAAPPGSVQEAGWVTVGHPGNLPDRTGLGMVADVFQIMRHEVTCGQYAEFLNAVAASDPHGLWDIAMGNALATETDPPLVRIGDDRVPQVMIDRIGADGAYRYRVAPGMEQMPIVNVSFLDALRFANWMHHAAASEALANGGSDAGRLADETETGAYDIASAGAEAVRTAAARCWVPSEDEWYKAAYHQPEEDGGPPGSYWLYPTRSQEPPLFRPAGNPDPFSANFLDDTLPGRSPADIGRRPRSQFVHLFPVGSFPEAASFYGTLDQGGNAWEWTDSVVFATQRVLRGGSMAHRVVKLRATVRSNAAPTRQYIDTGFRLARRVPPATGSVE